MSTRLRSGRGTLLCAALLAACSGPQRPAGVAALDAAAPHNAPIASPSAPIDLDGTWVAAGADDRLQPVGDKPAFTPAGRKLYDAHRRAAARGNRSWDATRRCLPPGLPRVLAMAQPFEVAVDPHLLLMSFQLQRLVRFVYLDDAYPGSGEATFLGESHGHWDGRALLIETGNFKAGQVLDGTGLPAGARLKVSERLELADDGTLVDHVTVDDEEMYQHPWQAELRFRRSSQAVREDVCVERAGQRP